MQSKAKSAAPSYAGEGSAQTTASAPLFSTVTVTSAEPDSACSAETVSRYS